MQKRSLTFVKLAVALAVATGLLAGTANAQPIMKGTFTLPYDVRWGQALVPAGTYTIVIDSAHNPALVSTQAGTNVAFVAPLSVNDARADFATALVINKGETERTVQSLNWREGNRSFVYKSSRSGHRRQASIEQETIAVRVASR